MKSERYSDFYIMDCPDDSFIEVEHLNKTIVTSATCVHVSVFEKELFKTWILFAK